MCMADGVGYECVIALSPGSVSQYCELLAVPAVEDLVALSLGVARVSVDGLAPVSTHTVIGYLAAPQAFPPERKSEAI